MRYYILTLSLLVFLCSAPAEAQFQMGNGHIEARTEHLTPQKHVSGRTRGIIPAREDAIIISGNNMSRPKPVMPLTGQVRERKPGENQNGGRRRWIDLGAIQNMIERIRSFQVRWN